MNMDVHNEKSKTILVVIHWLWEFAHIFIFMQKKRHVGLFNANLFLFVKKINMWTNY